MRGSGEGCRSDAKRSIGRRDGLNDDADACLSDGMRAPRTIAMTTTRGYAKHCIELEDERVRVSRMCHRLSLSHFCCRGFDSFQFSRSLSRSNFSCARLRLVRATAHADAYDLSTPAVD